MTDARRPRRRRFILDTLTVRGYPYPTFFRRPQGGAREQADVSAIQHSPKANAWLSEANEDASGSAGAEAAAGQGPEAPLGHRGQEVGPLGSASFPKRERLRKRAEFVDVKERGRKVHSDHFLLLWLRKTAGTSPFRVGLTVSGRVGNSVVRNRLKRWIREYVRHHKDTLPAGDLAIVAKASASDQAHDVVDGDLERLFGRAKARSADS